MEKEKSFILARSSVAILLMRLLSRSSWCAPLTRLRLPDFLSSLSVASFSAACSDGDRPAAATDFLHFTIHPHKRRRASERACEGLLDIVDPTVLKEQKTLG